LLDRPQEDNILNDITTPEPINYTSTDQSDQINGQFLPFVPRQYIPHIVAAASFFTSHLLNQFLLAMNQIKITMPMSNVYVCPQWFSPITPSANDVIDYLDEKQDIPIQPSSLQQHQPTTTIDVNYEEQQSLEDDFVDDYQQDQFLPHNQQQQQQPSTGMLDYVSDSFWWLLGYSPTTTIPSNQDNSIRLHSDDGHLQQSHHNKNHLFEDSPEFHQTRPISPVEFLNSFGLLHYTSNLSKAQHWDRAIEYRQSLGNHAKALATEYYRRMNRMYFDGNFWQNKTVIKLQEWCYSLGQALYQLQTDINQQYGRQAMTNGTLDDKESIMNLNGWFNNTLQILATVPPPPGLEIEQDPNVLGRVTKNDANKKSKKKRHNTNNDILEDQPSPERLLRLKSFVYCNQDLDSQEEFNLHFNATPYLFPHVKTVQKQPFDQVVDQPVGLLPPFYLWPRTGPMTEFPAHTISPTPLQYMAATDTYKLPTPYGENDGVVFNHYWSKVSIESNVPTKSFGEQFKRDLPHMSYYYYPIAEFPIIEVNALASKLSRGFGNEPGLPEVYLTRLHRAVKRKLDRLFEDGVFDNQLEQQQQGY
jgi:hypothetical protein